MDGFGSADILLFEGFRLDRRGGGLFRVHQNRHSTPVTLGARALDLLALLAGRAGTMVSKDAIMREVWPGKVVEEANVNVQISKLRQILDQNRQQGSCIQTVTGYGYRFIASVTRIDPSARPAIAPRVKWAGDSPIAGNAATVCVETAYRLARSTDDLMIRLAAATDRQAGVLPLDDIWGATATPQGRLMATVLRGLAQFEHDLNQAQTTDSRIRAGAGEIHRGREPDLTDY